jgi:hypothetical protein
MPGATARGEQEAALEVDVDDAGELLGAPLPGLGQLAEHAAGDIDQHVDPAARLGDDGVDARRIGDVDGQRPDALAHLDLARQAIAGDDPGAVRGEGRGRSPADAARGAGYDHCLAVEADLHRIRRGRRRRR